MAKRLTDNSVFVYFNLHKKLFSVRSRKTGKVIGHYHNVNLADAEFRVGQAGRAKVLREKKKNVHAGVAGEMVNDYHRDENGNYTLDTTKVTYNPYKYDSFVACDTERRVKSAKFVTIQLQGGIDASGVKYKDEGQSS